MAKIFGINGFGKVQLGFPVNINDCDIKPFTVTTDSNYVSDAGIPFGALLTYTGVTQVYGTPDTLASITSADIAGIAVGTNVLLDRTFPEGPDGNAYPKGIAGGCLVRGEIAVKLTGDTPSEGDAVYYDVAEQAFTKSSSSTVACVGFKFSGITEGDVTVINKLY